MNVDFFDENPHRPLDSQLRACFAKANRVDAAIAFVTKAGLLPFRTFMMKNPERARLVVSVCFPTNLDELAVIAGKMPGRLHLHLGAKEPRERKAERIKLHSKIILVENEGTARTIIVGSHNWTGLALSGGNLEAGVVIRCDESDSIVGDVRAHIVACMRESEIFDPSRLRLYKAVQWDLHDGPVPAESEAMPGFDEDEALVIVAEHVAGYTLPPQLLLFAPLADQKLAPFFVNRQRVLLYVYPPGGLFPSVDRSLTPTLYRGHIPMVNEVDTGAVSVREANAAISDLSAPTIHPLHASNVPTPTTQNEEQVVMALVRDGQEPFSVFHCGNSSPKMKVAAAYDSVSLGQYLANNADVEQSTAVGYEKIKLPETPLHIAGTNRRQMLTKDSMEDGRVIVRQATHAIVKGRVAVPGQMFLGEHLQSLMEENLRSSEFSENTDDVQIKLEAVKDDFYGNDYVFLVKYRFHLGHRQTRMFR